MGTPSDRMAKMAEQAMKKAKEPEEKLIITMDHQMRVAVNGPIHNKIMCFGMLKAAEIAISNFDPNRNQRVVIPELTMAGKPKG